MPDTVWLRCSVCGRRFFTYGGLLEHMESHVPEAEKRDNVRLQTLPKRDVTDPKLP